MQNEIHKYGLLCATAITLLMADSTFAVESPVTPGPSVGHRPVTTALILTTGPGLDITSTGTILNVGDTIGLASARGDDADGDMDKAGANCVWYRVDPVTNAATVARDPGPTDRNCHYTLQAADVGFKIKNTIKIYSDQDIAAAKGFTINPIESWPVDTVSATTVVSRSITYITQGYFNDNTFLDVDLGSRYQTVIKNGQFRINDYRMVSLQSNSSAISINGNTVTITGEPAGEIIITGFDLNGQNVSEFKFTPRKMFELVGTKSNPIGTEADAIKACQAMGMRMATLDEISINGDIDDPDGNFVYEWMIQSNYLPIDWYRISSSKGDIIVRPNMFDNAGFVVSSAANPVDKGVLCVKDL